MHGMPLNKILPLVSAGCGKRFEQCRPFVADLLAIQPRTIAFSPDILPRLERQQCRCGPAGGPNEVPRARNFPSIRQPKRSVGVSIELV